MKRRLQLATTIFFTFPIHAMPPAPGLINFSVGSAPISNPPVQPVTLYGCNNTLISSRLFWDTENQVLKNIPYGPFKSKSGKMYVTAKYYIASPEVKHVKENKKTVDIGLVSPDHFIFHGQKPAVLVNLNYQILNPVNLAMVPVDFNYPYQDKSCSEQGVKLVAINTECKDFPWKNGALGASGIGQLSIDPASTAFLPIQEKTNVPLQCQVTILDDIILDHQVFFATPAGKTKTINLTEFYQQSKPMQLICEPRKPEEVPDGCKDDTSFLYKKQ